MPFQLIIKPRAKQHIEEVYNWYEDQRIDLGEDFIEELDNYFETLKKSPTIFTKSGIDEFHQAFLKRFPYVIVFDIHKTDVVVYSVLHTSRNPDERTKL